MLDQITPLILTYNEAPNIGRTLERLSWAREIVVVDSFSDDETLEIISRFPHVRVFRRAFDSFAGQWSFGVKETGISTEWVMALDADFIITDELVEEMISLQPSEKDRGYKIPIVYCIDGRQLRSSLLPPLTVLYRRTCSGFLPDGHTHRVLLDGEIGRLNSLILHDDRKPLRRWLQSQQKHTILEGNKLLYADWNVLSWPDRIRRLRIVAPFAVLLYCLVYRRGILDGWPGIYYACQRMFVELLLSFHLLGNGLKGQRGNEILRSKEHCSQITRSSL
jgi:glycosyltransferase involved in cell wall biosynthesis